MAIHLPSIEQPSPAALRDWQNGSGPAMIKIVDAQVSFRSQRLATPLGLSSGTIEQLTEATASVVVEADGRRATGRGSIYLSDLWAWPSQSHSHEERDAALRWLCEMIASELPRLSPQQAHHPLELGLQLHDLACERLTLSPDAPMLARAMCGSPFDAAIHDGAGLLLGRSAFALYDQAAAIPSADRYFPESGACRAVAEVIQRPKSQLPAWFIVSMGDALEATLVPAIRDRGYCCFKLKLSGRDNVADAARTAEAYRAAVTSGVRRVRLSVDTNEANPSADSVLDYLDLLQSADAAAFAALEYLEQPTSRDIRRHAFDWRPVTARKPVLLDEGLTGLSLLAEAREQGYSGFALKTCKGHSMLLAAAAWAHQRGMAISLQDLTNPGLALIQAALTGACLPTINGVELNSPQFTPAANAEFADRLPELFEPTGGVHRLPTNLPEGLGSML